MSRFKRFAHSLVSGYVLLGANVLYTLASVPLALSYLSKSEFGLWALTTQIGGFIALVELGMGGSVARILIDHKDDHASGNYGGLIQTGVWVGIVQGLLILLVGTGLAFALGPLLHDVPAELQRDFKWLMIGQSAILCLSFAGRIFLYLLTAHQRFDISNYVGTANFVVGYATMWLLLARGWGVYSFIGAQGLGTVLSLGCNAWGCVRLKLFPRRGQWGRPTWVRFRELFAFGRDIFLFSLGGQLINASQTVLLTRFLGLDAAAVWSVCMRAYLLLLQMIYRVFDFSSTAFAEMIVRGETSHLARRFKEVVLLSASLSVALGALFAVCNGPFVEVWTAGKMSWSPVNNLLLAVWLILCVSVHAHVGLVGQTKQFRFLRYIYFIEGLAFVGLTVLLHRFGITGMLTISIACTLTFSLPYGLRRTREYFGLSWAELARWHRKPLVFLGWLTPVAAMAWGLTRDWPAVTELVLNGTVIGLWAVVMLPRFGLDESLQNELVERAPGWTRRGLTRLIGMKGATT